MFLNKVRQASEAVASGDFRRAVQAYGQAVALDPSNHILYTNRSAALFKLGRFQDSAQDARAARDLNPKWAKVRTGCGVVLWCGLWLCCGVLCCCVVCCGVVGLLWCCVVVWLWCVVVCCVVLWCGVLCCVLWLVCGCVVLCGWFVVVVCLCCVVVCLWCGVFVVWCGVMWCVVWL